MKKQISIHSNPSRYLLIGFVSIIIFSAMSYSLYSSNRMITKYAPLIDATIEIKYEITIAHLWLEEIISGDRYENIDDIIKHIDQKNWYARAILLNSFGKYWMEV